MLKLSTIFRSILSSVMLSLLLAIPGGRLAAKRAFRHAPSGI